MSAKQRLASAKCIAILEDDLSQANMIALWLERAGYDTVVRHDGDSFLLLIGEEKVDMLLLDWDVPGANGNQVLREARARFAYQMPIVMVTQHDDEKDIVRGLADGADDYMVKPVAERVLIARVEAQLRKYYRQMQSAPQLAYGGYVFDQDALTVTLASGALKPLPKREFALAYCLFENAGRVVSKDILFKQIWGAANQGDHVTLATYISRLRNTLELRAQKSGLVITTVYSYGYRLERAQDSMTSEVFRRRDFVSADAS